MKCKSLFSGKNKRNLIGVVMKWPKDEVQRVVNI